MKQLEVAIGNGFVLKCRMVNEEQYKQLLADNDKKLEKERLEKAELKRELNDLKDLIEELKKEIKVLKGEDSEETNNEEVY